MTEQDVTETMSKISSTLQRLRKCGYTAKRIAVQGRTITVTCASSSAADRWADVLGRMAHAAGARMHGPNEVRQEAKKNRGTVLRPTMVKVWVLGVTLG